MNEADRSTNAVNPEAATVDPGTDDAGDKKSTPVMSAPSSSHSPDWVALTQRLQFSSNIDHLNQVKQLRQALAESQQALNEYKEQANVRESLKSHHVQELTATLSQHVQELTATQSQMQRLCHELETAHKTVQRQQILIETLTVQVETSQERVAQLEREFALNQQRYNEQSYQLVQTENACRELRSRLSRQQSHTLQFKVALEKCLELPLPSYQFQTEDFLRNSSPSATVFSPISNSPSKFKTTAELPPILLPKAQPISPWSIAASENDVHRLPTFTEEGSLFINFSQDSSLAAHSDDALQPSSVGATPSTPVAAPQEIWESDTNEPESQYEDLFSLVEAEAESAVVDSPELVLPKEQFETPVSETPATNSDWPSPVVYPSRPPKGRKSFAAVELPIF